MLATIVHPEGMVNMANLRPIEIKLVDELTGMSSGYVLDFTNRTFAEFFQDGIGIDIYDDTYAEGSGSKGKRLRAFLLKAQPLAVARLLTALWEYREIARIEAGDAESIRHCRARLSAIVERLGGGALPDHDKRPPGQTALPPETKGHGPLMAERQRLRDDFIQLLGMASQARGYAFEKFLKKLFSAWDLNARGGFRNIGEQIDGSFVHDSHVYLLEAKWQAERTNAATLHAFQGKVSERPTWARGLFVSYEGFSEEAFSAFSSRQIILMDGMDIMDTLDRNLHLDEVIREKIRHAVERKEPLARTRQLFP